MSSSPLKSFNLGATYPFLDHTKSQTSAPPPPSQYPQGVPSPYFNYTQKPQSLPGSQPASPLSAPMPQYPPPQMVASYSTSSASSASSTSSASGSRGIFELYRPDGSTTPELEDVVSRKKKPTWSRK